jgi:prephenate dehydratase
MAHALRTEVFRELIDLEPLAAPRFRPLAVATLGPPGTSSELAARHVSDVVERSCGRRARVVLHGSFEAAATAVRHGDADAVVVANAYEHVNELYMDPRFALAGAFIMSTPVYGLVARPETPIPLSARIVTHPAPKRLISDLLPPGILVGEVVPAASTSEAARIVCAGQADLALTNETSRGAYELRFVSRTRPIEMLWSVFTRAEAA